MADILWLISSEAMLCNFKRKMSLSLSSAYKIGWETMLTIPIDQTNLAMYCNFFSYINHIPNENHLGRRIFQVFVFQGVNDSGN